MMIDRWGAAVYPAWFGHKIGPCAKSDYWWSPEVAFAMLAIYGGAPWGYISTSGVWSTWGALYANLHAMGYFAYPYYWSRLWTVMPNESLDQKWEVWEALIQAPNLVRNLNTGASYFYNVAPIYNSPVVAPALFISDYVYPPTHFPPDPVIG